MWNFGPGPWFFNVSSGRDKSYAIQSYYLFHSWQINDDFVRIALIHKEPLPFSGISHFHSILRNESVEEGIVFLSQGTCEL